jgi:hypothetical protein
VAALAADPVLLGRIRAHNALVPPEHDWPRAVATAAGLYDRALGVPVPDRDRDAHDGATGATGAIGANDTDGHGAEPASAA